MITIIAVILSWLLLHFLGFALVAPLRARREFHSIELQLKLNGPQEEAEAEEEEAEEGEETANLFFWGGGNCHFLAQLSAMESSWFIPFGFSVDSDV